ncbi:membrane protein YdbS with pleckstrin-like domain [Micromonospora kangleipakensis]|uniref:Membrane protein YdbS with pleckstrin-like domain n=1 Tax=Micromonospora kangleipakensis TaxID=1077942 RepID=A0A4Q8BFN9_9ACTN|nr:PH domain-containing protein [Micromonospora kangleipakensis]RZU76215.1 membrane protein YdbS with pleckstrin-like domain [Micromonospora kangleipakensis]
MGTTEMVLAVVLGLVVNEMTDLSPWLGRKLVAWSAWLRYQDTPRAGIRAEELAAVINDRPGKLFKLGTGLGFFSAALITRVRRLIIGGSAPGEEPVGDDLLGPRRVLPLEDEPTRWVARFLFPTERYRGEWRRHWIHPAKSLGVITLYAVLGVWAVQERIKPRYVGWVIALVVALAVLTAAHRVFAWYLGRFVITNKRLMSTEGVLFRRVGMIPLLRVTDMRYVQSPLGRLLNYGTFRLESASRRNVLRTIVDLPNPNELYLRLVEELYEPQAVEARLGRYVDEDEDAPDSDPSVVGFDEVGVSEPPGWRLVNLRPQPDWSATGPVDPASVRQEVIFRIAELSDHLAALTDAITRLEPASAPAAVPAGETAKSGELPTPVRSDEQLAAPDVGPAARGRRHADEQETSRPIPRRRRPTVADSLPDVGD